MYRDEEPEKDLWGARERGRVWGDWVAVAAEGRERERVCVCVCV